MTIVKVINILSSKEEFIEVPDIMWKNCIKEKKSVGYSNYDIHLDTKFSKGFPSSLGNYRVLFSYLQERASFPIDIKLERITVKKATSWFGLLDLLK